MGGITVSDGAPVFPRGRPADDQSQGWLAAIVESSEDAIIGKNLDAIITSWNPGAQRLYGYAPDEVIGQPISLLVPPDRPNELPSIMARLRRGERIQHYETIRIRKDSTRLDVSVSISPVRDSQGRIVGAASIARDITERRRAEHERDELLSRERAAREQLDAILGGVADGVVVQREDGTLIYANDVASRMAGFGSPSDLLSAGAFEVSRRLAMVDAEGQPFPFAQLPAYRAFRGEPAPEMIVQFRRADTDEVHWSRTQSRIVRGPDGNPLAISIFHDITDEMRSRDRLRYLAEAGAQLGGSLDVDQTLSGLARVATTTLADWAIVLLIEEDGSVRRIASAHRDPAKEPLIHKLSERQLQHASDAALLWQAIQNGEALLIPLVTDEMMARMARDEQHLALLRALGLSSLLYAPLVSGGRVQGAIALFMSDSGRRFGEEDSAIATEIARRASLALENARLFRETQDAVHARDEFLSIASHELRTPVTAISGVAQVALRSKQRGTLDDARLTRALEQLIRGSQRLVTLTEDLLDVSRLQAGRFELRPEELDLRAFVTDFVDRFGAQLGEQHPLVLDPDGTGRDTHDAVRAAGDAGQDARDAGRAAPGAPRDQPVMVRADPARLEQILANLLSNAVKYTPDGGTITVSVTRIDGRACVAVRDEGIGLPAGAEEAIFEPFGRAPNAAHRQIQGLGLGLYICRQIAERHDGRIWAESAGDGQGTTMHVWLPSSDA